MKWLKSRRNSLLWAASNAIASNSGSSNTIPWDHPFWIPLMRNLCKSDFSHYSTRFDTMLAMKRKRTLKPEMIRQMRLITTTLKILKIRFLVNKFDASKRCESILWARNIQLLVKTQQELTNSKRIQWKKYCWEVKAFDRDCCAVHAQSMNVRRLLTTTFTSLYDNPYMTKSRYF